MIILVSDVDDIPFVGTCKDIEERFLDNFAKEKKITGGGVVTEHLGSRIVYGDNWVSFDQQIKIENYCE